MSRMKELYCDMCDVITSVNEEGNCLQLKDVLKAFYKPIFKEWNKNNFDGSLTNSVWRDNLNNYDVYLSHYSNGLVWSILIYDNNTESIITRNFIIKK